MPAIDASRTAKTDAIQAMRALHRTGHFFLLLSIITLIPTGLIDWVPWFMPVGPALVALKCYLSGRIVLAEVRYYSVQEEGVIHPALGE